MRRARVRGAARPTCNECTPEWQRERVDSTFGYDARMHLLQNGLRVLASSLLAGLPGCSVVPGYASSDAHGARGRALQAQGNHAAALAEYTRALERNPHNRQAYDDRVNARIAMGDFRDAIDDCDRGLARDPRWAALYYYRGVARAPNVPVGGTNADLVGKDVDGALKDHATSIALSPEQSLARVARMHLFIAMGDFDRAGAEVDGLAKVQPHNPFWTGLVHFLRGEDAEAQVFFDRSFKATPEIRADAQADLERIRRRRPARTP